MPTVGQILAVLCCRYVLEKPCSILLASQRIFSDNSMDGSAGEQDLDLCVHISILWHPHHTLGGITRKIRSRRSTIPTYKTLSVICRLQLALIDGTHASNIVILTPLGVETQASAGHNFTRVNVGENLSVQQPWVSLVTIVIRRVAIL